MKPQRLAPPLRAKAALFQLLEALSDLRGNNTRDQLELQLPHAPRPAAWVFVSTIGELNAIEPWLRELAAQIAPVPLLLITDHSHYRDSYQARYPQAVVCVSRGHGRDAATIARHYPPRLLVVAEIPALPLDAPCRFATTFVLEAKRRGAPTLLVNGWVYGYKPACTMDRIELALFGRDYLRCFDRLCVQTEAVAERLVAAGAAPEQLAVCGNIKFDAMAGSDWTPSRAHSPRLLQALLEAGRPIIVAGCVTSAAEQTMVLEAFGRVRQHHPKTLLVLAPRHPEVSERMQALRALLARHGLAAAWRSELTDEALPAGCDCLTLDTMGDLRDFYAAASVAHVGVDHNVLEPLGFERPVTVLPGWEPSYPSYPVFEILRDCGALRLAQDVGELAANWLALLDAGPAADAERLAESRAALARAKGAVRRHFTALQTWIAPLC